MATVFELEKKVKPNGTFNQAIFNTLSSADQNRLKALDKSRQTGKSVNYESGSTPSNWINDLLGTSGGGNGGGSSYTSSAVSSSNSGAMTADEALRQGKDINELRRQGLLIEAPKAAPSAQDFFNNLKAELQKQIDTFNARDKEFTSNNPFTFDEIQAKASASERYNPYYDSELQDFMKGVNAQRSTLNGEKALLTDLNKIQTAQDQTKLNETIRKREEGYAGSGLFFSGSRQRDTGLANIAGNQQNETREGRFNQNILENTNQLGQLQTNQDQTFRRTNAQRTTDITTDVERQRAEETSRYAQERQQYIGYPYTSSSGAQQGLMDTLLGSFT